MLGNKKHNGDATCGGRLHQAEPLLKSCLVNFRVQLTIISRPNGGGQIKKRFSPQLWNYYILLLKPTKHFVSHFISASKILTQQLMSLSLHGIPTLTHRGTRLNLLSSSAFCTPGGKFSAGDYLMPILYRSVWFRINVPDINEIHWFRAMIIQNTKLCHLVGEAIILANVNKNHASFSMTKLFALSFF